MYINDNNISESCFIFIMVDYYNIILQIAGKEQRATPN